VDGRGLEHARRDEHDREDVEAQHGRVMREGVGVLRWLRKKRPRRTIRRKRVRRRKRANAKLDEQPAISAAEIRPSAARASWRKMHGQEFG